jgi:hypothetical protein
VDDDDTIEPDLCEKAVAVADAEQADTTYFFFDRGERSNSADRWSGKMKELIGKQNLTERDYLIFLQYPYIWVRLWRSRFLLDNDIQCPAGQQCSEDIFMSWQTLVHNTKIALLPKIMYHYRFNPLSVCNEPTSKYVMGIPTTFDLIKEMLRETGNYHGNWKRLFLHEKLRHLCVVYNDLPTYRRAEYLRMVKDRLGQDEQEYLLQKNSLKRRVKVFYYALQGSHFAVVESTVHIALRKAEIVFRKFRDKWKHWLVNS